MTDEVEKLTRIIHDGVWPNANWELASNAHIRNPCRSQARTVIAAGYRCYELLTPEPQEDATVSDEVKLSHEELCYLSRIFNAHNSNCHIGVIARINDWLGRLIAEAAPVAKPTLEERVKSFVKRVAYNGTTQSLAREAAELDAELVAGEGKGS